MDEVTPEGLSDVEYWKKLRIIDDKINDLTDGILDNDKQAKEAIWNIMDEAFLNWLKTYFKNPEHKNELNKFVEGICSVLYKALDDFRKANPWKDFSEFSSQFKFLWDFVKEIADKLGIRKEITDKIKAITDEFRVNVTWTRDIQVSETVANESDAVIDADNNRGFDIVDNIETNIDTERINAYICSKIWSDKDIIRWTKDWYKCNMQNVKEFLSKITSGEIPFDRNFVAKNSDSRMAWITAVQLMLNAEDWDKIKVDWKFWPKTSNRVKAFQEKYNSTVQNWEAELAVDGIPWKNTMKALLMRITWSSS